MMTDLLDVFADTVFWIGLLNKSDQYAARATAWSQKILGKMITTDAVLTETAFFLRNRISTFLFGWLENCCSIDGW